MPDRPDPELQTPAQWAVRWHGVVLAALLIASVPILHLVWHGVLGHEAPVVLTRGQVQAPAPTRENVLDGTWMPAKERELREASPIVWWLRSSWNEACFRAGAPRSTQVHVGRDGWFFLRHTVGTDRVVFDRRREVRRKFFAAVRDHVRAAGAELFVYVVPDKSRVYPEFAFATSAMPPARAQTYPAVLEELASLGIDTVDVAAAMAAARAAAPDDDLYYHHDTHWRPAGALAGARAVAIAIESGRLGALLSPRRAIELLGKDSIPAVGDLTAMLGLGTIEIPATKGTHTVPMSFLTQQLAETRDYYGIALRENGQMLPLLGDADDAEVLVAGTSFSEENGWRALSLALGRPVRAVFERGAGGTEPARAVVRLLQQGARPKLVVWEIVERGLSEDEWRAPKL